MLVTRVAAGVASCARGRVAHLGFRAAAPAAAWGVGVPVAVNAAFSTSPAAYKPPYCVPVAPPVRAGESAIYRNSGFTDALVASYRSDGPLTLFENFSQGRAIAEKAHGPGAHCLGERIRNADGSFGPYAWMTYAQVEDSARRVGTALLNRGIGPGGKVGIYSKNCAAYAITEIGLTAYSLVSVPLYDTLGVEALEHIVGLTEMTAVVCAKDAVSTLATLSHKCPKLSLVIVIDSGFFHGQQAAAGGAGTAAATAPAAAVAEAAPSSEGFRAGVSVTTLTALQSEVAAGATLAPIPPKPSDVSTIIFTSGTTGVPKGAMLTQANLIAAGAGLLGAGIHLNAQDTHVSYLPLAHVYERIVLSGVYHFGARTGFYTGDVQKLLDDMLVLRPTIFPSVPRLFNRVYAKVHSNVAAASLFKRVLFNYALKAKLRNLHHFGVFSHPLFDRLVFNKLRALMGGRVRIIVTSSAPIAAHVKEFLQVAFNCPVFEALGMTEVGGTLTITPANARSLKGVGPPVSCNEVKVVDVPEMGYYATDKPEPRGELCFRGPNVFVGYYKSPELTAEAIDSEGWLHTGDVGRITTDGSIVVVDRKKNVFKLSQGEYVAPERVENILNRSHLVAQAFVYGDSLRSSLVGVVVPEPENAKKWAAGKGVPGDLPSLCSSADFKAAVLSSMQKSAEKSGLKGFEVPKAIHLDPNPFTVENGIMTPTFKLRRPQAKKVYASVIDALYSELAAAEKAQAGGHAAATRPDDVHLG